MSHWRNSVLAFSAVPELAILLLERDPAWVWTRDGRLLWANPAGGALLGVDTFADLVGQGRVFGRSLGREIESLMRSAPDKGTMARLRLVDDLRALPIACQCRRVRAGDQRGLLAVALEKPAPRLGAPALATFFSDKEAAACVFDAAGRVLAGSEAAAETSAEAYGAFAEFREGDQGRRLYILPRRPDATRPLPEAGTPRASAEITGTQEPEPAAALAERPQTEMDAVEAEAAQGGPALPLVDAPGEAAKPPLKRTEPAPVRDAPANGARRVMALAAKKGPHPAPARATAASAMGAGQSGGQQAAALPKPRPPVSDPADPPHSRAISAGRVARELSRKPVRFLWQTDSADRFLFVSPGLAQVVGRNAEIVGERWPDAAGRLRLDPTQKIARAVAQRDTWSGQTAWWPIEGSNVRVPAELTALPIFGADHSFQGYRGFGVLRPAEALMPAAFEARFGATDAATRPAEQMPSYEEASGASPAQPDPAAGPPAGTPTSSSPANVVPIRADLDRAADQARLTAQERSAFEEIAAALRERVIEAPPVAAEAVSGAVEDAMEAAGAESFTTPPPQQGADPDSAVEGIPSGAVAPPAMDPPPSQAEVVAERGLAAGEAASTSNPPIAAQVAPEPSADRPADTGIHAPAVRNQEIGETPPEAPIRAKAEKTASVAQALRQDGKAQRRVQELTAILDTATDGVLILDAEGTIESVNAGAEALFGLEAHELQGTDFGELLTPESRQLALDYLSGLIDNGVASVLNEGREIEAQAGPGSIPLFMTMGRISGEDGGRFCAVLRDITQWKRTEAELVAAKRAAEEASAQKSEFIARVSHEIRTPLNAIIGFAEVMIEQRFGPIGNERYSEYIRDIRASGEHVVSLVNDLLDISKIEAGKLDLDFAAVPLNDVVRECIGLMQPQANRARVVLRSSLSRDVPAIVADGRTLRQIVLNLLSNSVKFTGPGGQVIASTSLLESGEALLRIRDTGEGMSEEELARAMEPFRQIATATLSDRTGSGLGLPLTKALVEANRATLAIRSARGEGTVVTVTFPPTRVLSE